MDQPAVQTAPEAVPAPPVHYALELLDKRQEFDDIWSFSFRRVEPFDFRAGQYVHLKLDAPHIEKTVHHMSLASAPGDAAVQFTMHIRPQSQYKLHLARLAPGGRASLFKIKGEFVLPEAADSPVVMLANGIGVTPFRSMLRDAQLSGRELDATLLHVGRGGWLFADELAQLPAREQRRITREGLAEQLARTVADKPQARWYIAGSPSFVFGQQEALLGLGVAEERILLDNFKAYDELDG